MNLDASMQLLGSYLIIALLGIINYVFSALAIYKVAKEEKIKNPWLAWIPVTNPYLLIKLGGGNLLFIIIAIISLLTGNYFNGFMTGGLKIVGIVVTAIWSLYSIYMYSKICDRYDVGIWFFILGFIFQLISSMLIVGVIVLAVGNWKIYKNAKSNLKTRRIESTVYYNKGSIKGKKDKKK